MFKRADLDAIDSGHFGLSEGADYEENAFVSATPDVKIFLGSSGFGVRKVNRSFYFRIDNSTNSNLVNIVSLYPSASTFLFSARGKFWTQEKKRKRFGEDSQTYRYYARQSFLSKAELRKLITITKPNQIKEKEGMRLIRM